MLSDTREIRVRRWIGAARDRVWEVLTDPDEIRQMPGISSLTVLQEDDDPDDTGALGHRREVVLGPGRFVEEITRWDPPRRFEYRIVEASVPIEHEGGHVELTEHNGGTRIEWTSSFRVQAPAFANLIARWADQQMEHLLDRHVQAMSQRLDARRVQPRQSGTAVLPEPVARYLSRSAAADVDVLDVDLDGRLKLNGQWYDFASTLTIEPLAGYRWAARVHRGPIRFSGADDYDGHGHMLWKLYGLVPVVRAGGDDVTHSARGRAALEQIFLPCALARPEVDWSDAGDGWFRAGWVLDGHEVGLDLQLDPEGRLHALRTQRWSDAEGTPWREVTFGGDVLAEGSFAGMVLPSRVAAGWFYGEDRWEEGRFFEARVTGARPRQSDSA